MIALTRKLLRFFPLTFLQVDAAGETDLAGHAVFPEGFHGTNPSFVRFGDGFLVCLRGVNYVLEGSDMTRPVFTSGDRYMTVNRFFLVDRSFRLQRALPGLDDAFDDVEDIKLFEFDGVVMGCGSAADPAGAPGNRAIALLTVDPVAERGTRRLLASPFGFALEKNWAPFVHAGLLHFVYSFDPLVVLRYDPGAGGISFLDADGAGVARGRLRFLVGGSSAGLAVPGGFLFVAHRRRVSVLNGRRAYVSRVFHLDTAAMRLTAGRWFSVGPPGVQFINGFTQQGDELVLSLGAGDHSGHVCRVAKAPLMPALMPSGVRGWRDLPRRSRPAGPVPGRPS